MSYPALGGSGSVSDLLTNPTVIPGGSFVTIGFSQDLLGALNLSVSWSDLANQWIANLPWPTYELLINDTFAEKDAIVQIYLPADTTIGQVGTLANNISADVSIIHMWINVGRADAATLEAQLAANPTAFALCVEDPIACAGGALTKTALSLIPTAAIVLAAVLAGVYVLRQVETTRTYQRVAA